MSFDEEYEEYVGECRNCYYYERERQELKAEIERLRAELAEAQADRMRGNCKIMADDCDCGLCKREREIERLQGQVADMSLVIERLRDLLNRFRSEVRMYCRPGMVQYDVFPVFREVDDLFDKAAGGGEEKATG